MTVRKPKVKQKIVHSEPEFPRETTGTVTALLSAQFAYETPEGITRYCLYKEIWRPLETKVKSC